MYMVWEDKSIRKHKHEPHINRETWIEMREKRDCVTNSNSARNYQ